MKVHWGWVFLSLLMVLVKPVAAQHITTKQAPLDTYQLQRSISEKKSTQWKMPTLHTSPTFKLTWDHYCPPCLLDDQTLCPLRPCQDYNLMVGSTYQNIQADDDPWIKLANEEALKSVKNGGGPFAAIILQIDDTSGKVIRYWINHNHVVEWRDPTAHAEITAIRAATRELGVVNLGHIQKSASKLSQPGEWSHCVIYSSAESCPMCLSAIYWAGIKNTVFAATRYDATVKGVEFSDDMIYKELARPYQHRKHMHVLHSNTNNSLDAFNYYKRNNVGRYGSTP